MATSKYASIMQTLPPAAQALLRRPTALTIHGLNGCSEHEQNLDVI